MCLAGNGDERSWTWSDFFKNWLHKAADMVLHDADQVEIQTVDDSILNKYFFGCE